MVEVLNGPGLVSGLRLVELPPHELDPVLHAANLALKVGADISSLKIFLLLKLNNTKPDP